MRTNNTSRGPVGGVTSLLFVCALLFAGCCLHGRFPPSTTPWTPKLVQYVLGSGSSLEISVQFDQPPRPARGGVAPDAGPSITGYRVLAADRVFGSRSVDDGDRDRRYIAWRVGSGWRFGCQEFSLLRSRDSGASRALGLVDLGEVPRCIRSLDDIEILDAGWISQDGFEVWYRCRRRACVASWRFQHQMRKHFFRRHFDERDLGAGRALVRVHQSCCAVWLLGPARGGVTPEPLMVRFACWSVQSFDELEGDSRLAARPDELPMLPEMDAAAMKMRLEAFAQTNVSLANLSAQIGHHVSEATAAHSWVESSISEPIIGPLLPARMVAHLAGLRWSISVAVEWDHGGMDRRSFHRPLPESVGPPQLQILAPHLDSARGEERAGTCTGAETSWEGVGWRVLGGKGFMLARAWGEFVDRTSFQVGARSGCRAIALPAGMRIQFATVVRRDEGQDGYTRWAAVFLIALKSESSEGFDAPAEGADELWMVDQRGVTLCRTPLPPDLRRVAWTSLQEIGWTEDAWSRCISADGTLVDFSFEDG